MGYFVNFININGTTFIGTKLDKNSKAMDEQELVFSVKFYFELDL